MKFFGNCSTLDELKREYRRAARLHHPDIGGDTETMQQINAEYSERFELLKNQQNRAAAEDETGRTKATTETAGEFIEIIEKLLTMEGLKAELVGSWVWCSGDTMKWKDQLKALGFRWSRTKHMWHWCHREPGEQWKRGGKKSMDEIRRKYGSTVFERGEREYLPA